MYSRKGWVCQLLLFAALGAALPLAAQPAQDEKKEPDKKGFFFAGPMQQRRKLVAQFDKDGDGRLNAAERQAAREFLKKDRANKGPGGKGPFTPAGKGFGPGMFLAKPLITAVDSDADGKLTQDELRAGIKKFFADCDNDRKGKLDESQLAEGLNRIIPAPKFGPPKDGPPKDKPKDDPKGDPKGPPQNFLFKGPPGFMRLGDLLAGSILKRADADKDGKLTLDEMLAAAETLFKEADKDKTGKLDEAAVVAGLSPLLPVFGPPGGFGKREPAKPGPKVTPADVKTYPDAGLYDTTILRTIFLEFDNPEWEAELADFYHTDVEVPATVIVDGKKYADVGIHFRGNSSYFGVPAGYKHSLNLSFDFVSDKQKLYGYRTLNLLNANQDPTFMHSVLFCNISRQYLPAPKANFVKVVINGESWGVYANQQQVNKEFFAENFKATKGARWKVPGHPGARGGLDYIGETIADYKRHYEIRSKDDEKSWKALIELCRTLSKTPADQLEAALEPMLDIDGVLWFLAMEIVTCNDDGYWTRASDYDLYRDPKGKFHVIAHDTNETFQPANFFGFGKGPKDGAAGGYKLDPLTGLNDTNKPLRSRLLAVPGLRAKYLDHVRTIANDWLDWNKLRPVVEQYRALIEKEIELDTRKLSSLAEFRSAVADEAPTGGAARFNLRAFADGRRGYLLNYVETKK
jgi:hypothetical protein